MHVPHRARRLMVAAAVLVLFAGCGSDDAASPAVADPLPDLTLTGLDGGEPVDLSVPVGTPRVLNLWASWCAPCRAELPVFDEAAGRFDDQIAIVGVNVGDDADTAGEVVDDLALGFPQLLDPDSELNAALQITNMPSTVFVDDTGSILDIHAGALTAEELSAMLDELFGV